MNVITKWLQKASKKQKLTLAAKAATSPAYLYQLSAGMRSADPALAKRLELAAAEISGELDVELPAIHREDLCPACAQCEFVPKRK